MEKELILEIGTEEIPALFLENARDYLRSALDAEFCEQGIKFGSIEVFYTPRRLSARVSELKELQSDRITETFGPPVRIAFDENGEPTKAALGFARAQGIDVSELTVVKRQNGEFLCAKKTVKGTQTSSALEDILPKAILSIPFKKSMRWGAGKTTFARPIRWITAVYNSKIINFNIENVKSCDLSFGHRFTCPKPFQVSSWKSYINDLEKKDVILDPEKRKEIIKKEADDAAKKVGGKIEQDQELLETVANLVEHPTVLVGKFEEKYLDLPEEVLVSVMKGHQKYFPVRSAKTDRLLSSFVFVCGTPVSDKTVVIRGNEKVIRARLNDAEFFFSEDTKNKLEHYTETLDSMVFLSEIGSYRVKVERIKTLAAEMFSDPALERAAELSKSDLATLMVFEFPELQGVMGKYYSLTSGEKKAVATAIEEHYMPLSRTDKLPETKTGALLSIVDKIDSICSCFIANLVPTGSSDPYALRRQTLGIIRITIEKALDISLKEIIERSVKLVFDSIDEEKTSSIRRPNYELEQTILGFFSERFHNLMTESGYERNVVESVVEADFDNPLDALHRIKAVSKFAASADFETLSISFKRVFNIAKTRPSIEFNEKLLTQKEEKDLRETFCEVQSLVSEKLCESGKTPTQSDYASCLLAIKTLAEPIDNFFDAVMVMDKDEKTRNNRLVLLSDIKDLFFRIADFSKA